MTIAKLRNTLSAAVLLGLAVATPASADFQAAMAAWQQQDYRQAMSELVPVAAAGNADAQELIGVLYALGLGVKQDRVKAFEWYLVSAENGHAGAQSGVGWYYELGLGGVPIDFVQAHMWYTLSTIGGDIDAAISLEDIETQMTPEQISQAQQMAADYLAR